MKTILAKMVRTGVMGLVLTVGVTDASAQTTNRDGTTGTSTTTRTDGNTDRGSGSNWGWLGLVGLIGLVGLMRGSDTSRYRNGNTTGGPTTAR
jgi:hypothetical protein